MKKLKHTLSLAILILFLTGCKKDKFTDDYKTLVGTWTSISTYSGGCGTFVGHAINPNFRLVLLEKGKYKLYSGDKKIEEGRLQIKNNLVTFIQNNLETFHLTKKKSRLHESQILKFNSDTLNIDRNGCDDDYAYSFVKN